MRPTLLPLVTLAVLTGCSVGPSYVRPELPQTKPNFSHAGTADAAAPSQGWWRGLNDPVLTNLIERGLRDAPTIAVAEARVMQARASLAVAHASQLPKLSTSAMYVYAKLPNSAFGSGSGNNEFYTLGFDANWEADLWGGQRRRAQQVHAQAETAEARLADLLVSLSAEIARDYVALRANEETMDLLAQREALETELVRISQSRFSGGTGTREALAGARQQLAGTQTENASLAAETAILRDTLAILTGQLPGSLDDLPNAAIPLPPQSVKVGDPSAMLSRRPDIIAAERQLAAATAAIGIEKARWFPSVSLLGLVGIGGTSISDVFDTSQLSAFAVPRLSWSFLDFGQTAGRIRGAKAGRDAALAEYQSSILSALQDAEASLARFGAARVAYLNAVQTSSEAAEVARLQKLSAKAGAIAPQQGVDAGIRLLNDQIARAQRQSNMAQAYVALTKSLGLGWRDEGADKDVVPAQ